MLFLGVVCLWFVTWAFITLVTRDPLMAILTASVAFGLFALLILGITFVSVGLQTSGVVGP